MARKKKKKQDKKKGIGAGLTTNQLHTERNEVEKVREKGKR